MHCSPEWRKNAMIWMHYVWAGLLAKMTLHCWIIAISLPPQHNEILLLIHITHFICKVQTDCVLYLGLSLCVHGIQMLANELKHWLGRVPYLPSPDQSHCGSFPQKVPHELTIAWSKYLFVREADGFYCMQDRLQQEHNYFASSGPGWPVAACRRVTSGLKNRRRKRFKYTWKSLRSNSF